MHLSVITTGYLGTQMCDTTHMGSRQLLRFASAQQIVAPTTDVLLKMCGVSASAESPLAKFLYAGECADFTDKQALFLVQPVHLALQRDTFSMQEIVQLTLDEYVLLTDVLNDYFKQERLEFIPSKTLQYWYLNTAAQWQASTHLAQTVMHRDVHHFQPAGHDAPKMRQIMNQAQMLFHTHAINELRSAHRHPEVNSIWISGGGQLIAQSQAQFEGIMGHGALFDATGACSKKSAFSDLEAIIASNIAHGLMVYEDTSRIPWNALLAAIKLRKIKRLDVFVAEAGHTLKYTLKPLDTWKFWKKY